MDCHEPLSLVKRFSIWSDLLVERQLTESMVNAISLGKKAKKKARKSLSKQTISDQWLPDREESATDKTVRPGSKRSTKRNKSKKPVVSKSCSSNSKKNARRKLNKKSPLYKLTMEIASKLDEPRRDLITNVIKTLGDVMALRFLAETLDVESAGGLMTSNSSRRRSPGGTFFHLIKHSKHVTQAHLDAIFGLDQATHGARRKLKKKQAKKMESLADNLQSFNLTGEQSMQADASSRGDQNEACNSQSSILDMV